MHLLVWSSQQDFSQDYWNFVASRLLILLNPQPYTCQPWLKTSLPLCKSFTAIPLLETTLLSCVPWHISRCTLGTFPVHDDVMMMKGGHWLELDLEQDTVGSHLYCISTCTQGKISHSHLREFDQEQTSRHSNCMNENVGLGASIFKFPSCIPHVSDLIHTVESHLYLKSVNSFSQYCDN